jgi:hypothetical protein
MHMEEVVTDATKYDGATLGELLDIVGSKDPILTSQVKAFLTTMNDDPLELLMSLKGLKLAAYIKTKSEGSITEPGAVATRIRQLVTEQFVDDTLSTTPVASGPQTITVEMPTTRESMDLEALLTELLKHKDKPDVVADLILRVNQQLVVKAAATRLGHERWAIAGDDGLDVSQTLRYLSLAANPDRMIPSGRWENHVPVALKKALGLEISTMIFAFAVDVSELLFDGIDMHGNDWRKLDDDTYEAMVYHVLVTQKLSANTQMERDRLLDELFDKNGLSPTLARLVDEYVIHLEGRNERRMSHYMSRSDLEAALGQAVSLNPKASGGRLPFGGSTTPPQTEGDENWYRKELERLAEPAMSRNGGSIRHSNAIVESIQASGGSVRLE